MPHPRLKTAFVAVLSVLFVVSVSAGASARAVKPQLMWVHCLRLCQGPTKVAPGGYVKLAGHNLGGRLQVVFPIRRGGAKAAANVKAASAGRNRLKAKVPGNAISGHVYVRVTRGPRSNAVGPIYVTKAKTAPNGGSSAAPSGTAFDGNGMWIWYVNKSNGGDLNAIVQQAHAAGMSTVFVKSGDGTNYWSQFSSQLVQTLHAGGLRVCAWHYVYGDNPDGEAAVSAQAVTAGADCFVIDAEGEYEKKYGQAAEYMQRLRAAVGPNYPIALASFPYVDYHPSFPYSVFLAPGNAQFNAPQIYWKEIGGGLDPVVDHSYRYNRPYGRPIDPLGQTYDNPPQSDLTRFRQLAAADGSAGLSWWDWQETSASEWQTIGAPLGPLAGPPPSGDYATLQSGSKGDLVVWAQQHLKGAGQNVSVDGDYGTQTKAAVMSFQTSAGLPPSGQIDTATWQALLQHAPVAAKWNTSSGAHAAGAAPRYSAPPSAKLPPRRYEIPAHAGRG